MHKYKGIVLLGLGAFDTSLLSIYLYRQSNWAIWTMNDFWTYYPDLKPDQAYQIHKDSDEHVDEFGAKRDARGFLEYCKKIGVKDIRYDLSEACYSWYFGRQPKQWYQSTVNYMFVDAWRLIEKGKCGPRIALEGMPFIGSGEREKQRAFIMSAIEMSILRGIDTHAPHWEEWRESGETIDWTKLMDVETYGLTQRDAGVIGGIVDNRIAKLKADLARESPFKGKLPVTDNTVFGGSEPSEDDAWDEIEKNIGGYTK